MPNTPERPVPYPGRPELDQANARFRRAAARLHKEAVKHDPNLMPALSSIVAEAAEHLGRLAGDLEAAESSSARNKRVLKAAEDKMRATLRPAARRGDERAARLLARLDERQRRREQQGQNGDDAA
ncbi:hypothetical protein J7F03_28435 [Streptomyces sp. ISL-43]|uniref:hypothetical protein n=1 Tax=Streptomyces sp. ISL-43 TaxID=2819183 RepID=UPI001BE8798E|nr:hypothetical protein [Streptomyces sp. ISL-43]MBT2450933.1 hypothetical protein [Streptomyces sp. ISL-43]